MKYNRIDDVIGSTVTHAKASPMTQTAMRDAFSYLRGAAATSATAGSAQTSRRSTGRRGLFGAPRWAQVCTALAIAVLCTGGTAFAAVQLGLINLQPQGAHQTALSIDAGTAAAQGAVEDYALRFSSLPDDAVPVDVSDHVQKWDWNDGATHLSSTVYYLDSSDPLPVSFITGTEPVTVNGHEGVLFEQAPAGFGDTVRDMYVVYPEQQRVVWLWSDSLDGAQLQQLAEGIELEPNGKTVNAGPGEGPDALLLWSDVIDTTNAVEAFEPEDLWLNATAADMAATHKVGETFAVPVAAVDSAGEFQTDIDGVQATVTDVTVSKSLAGLTDESQIESSWRDLVQTDGTLGSAAMKYLRCGDGSNTLDELLATRELPVSVVEVSVDYTNTGSDTLSDVLVLGTIIRATQGADGWSIYDQASAVDGAEVASASVPALTYGDPHYLTIDGAHAGEKNHVDVLTPGETATVHLAWLVPDEELDKLLLNLSSYGRDYEFTEDALAIGYVDIRR